MSKVITIPESTMRGTRIKGQRVIVLSDLLLFLYKTKDLNDHVIVDQTLEMLIKHLEGFE